MSLDKYTDQSTLTITPNNRLQQELTERIVKEARSNFIDQPKIFSLSALIQECWHIMQTKNIGIANKQYLLTPESSLMQWVDVIRQDNSLETIMSVTELANEASSADRKATLWCCEGFDAQSIEEWTFLKWRQKIRSLRTNCLTEDEAVPHIINALSDGLLHDIKNVCLFSFDDIPPLHKSLFDGLGIGRNVFNDSFSSKQSPSTLWLESYDKEQQWDNVANWCVDQLNNKPNQKIAIVAPDLKQEKEGILNALDAAFEPQVILPNTPTYTPPYNVTAGTPLFDVPIVKAAYALLSAALNEVSLVEILSIMKSPFIGNSQSEMASRAIYDVFVREQGKTRLTLLDLIAYGQCPPKLMNLIGSFANVIANRPEATSLMNWATFFESALHAIGWPGERNLDSNEFQAMNQFIDRVCTMTQHFQGKTEMTYDDALFYLYTTLVNNTFSPESNGSPIEVLGMLEAAGMPFDTMILLDMNEGTVPSIPSPNSFLPDDLQIELEMPHANAQRELAFFESVLCRYRSCCDTLVFSTYKFDLERELNPSIFVKGPKFNIDDITTPETNYISHLFKRIPVKTVDESFVAIGEKERVSGGTTLLKMTAECPFKAIAVQRMKIEKLPTAQEGISSSDRGRVLHLALAGFWEKQKDHATLINLSHDELTRAINCAVDEAFMSLRGRTDIEPALINMEQQALSVNISHWMEIEKSRRPFIVESIEAVQITKLDNHDIHTRLDRVDLIEDDEGNFTRRLMIDHKSSMPSLSSLAKIPITEPQLPIYAIGNEQADKTLAGIAYGVIKKNACQLTGLSNETELAKGITALSGSRLSLPSSWEQTMLQWKKALNEVMNDYLSGDNTINVQLSSCQFCTNSLVCRLNQP